MLVLHSARRPDLSSMLLIEKSKTIFNQKNNCAWLGIIQIQRSFNLQLFNGKRLNRFFSRHTTNFAAGSAGPKDLELVAHLMGFLLWPTEWSSFDEGSHELQVLLSVFQLFFCVFCFDFIFYIKFLFFAVNTMSLLGIQTTICVSLNSK